MRTESWGRSVGIVKTTYRILKQRCATLSDERLIIWSSMCRNLAPNAKSGMSPSQIMLGRSDVISMMESRNWLPIEERNDEMLMNQNILQGLLDARNAAAQADARNIAQAGMQRPLRTNANYRPTTNDTVSVFQKILREPRARWHHGYRVIARTDRHAILERTNRIFKLPLFQVRKDGEQCEIKTRERIIEGETNDNGRSLDKSAGSSNDAILVQYHSKTGASKAQDQLSYGVVDGFEDAIDEMTFQHVASIAGVGNRSEWKTWISGQITDNALMTEGEVEKEALIGHDLNRITPKGFFENPIG